MKYSRERLRVLRNLLKQSLAEDEDSAAVERVVVLP